MGAARDAIKAAPPLLRPTAPRPGRIAWLHMITIAALTLPAVGLAETAKGGASLDQRHVWNFDADRVGEPPAALAAVAPSGAAGGWTVASDPRSPSPPNHVIVTSDCPGDLCFHLLLAEGLRYEYSDSAVRLRPSGQGPQGSAGLAFAASGPGSFYAALVDFDARMLEVVHVRDDQVVVLGRQPIVPRDVAWHTLRVQHNTILSKDFLEITFDGKIVFSHWDKALGSGQVGLVMRGAGTMAFDSFHVVQLYSQRPLSPPAAY